MVDARTSRARGVTRAVDGRQPDIGASVPAVWGALFILVHSGLQSHPAFATPIRAAHEPLGDPLYCRRSARRAFTPSDPNFSLRMRFAAPTMILIPD